MEFLAYIHQRYVIFLLFHTFYELCIRILLHVGFIRYFTEVVSVNYDDQLLIIRILRAVRN